MNHQDVIFFLCVDMATEQSGGLGFFPGPGQSNPPGHLPHPQPIPSNIVRFLASSDCYIGATEDLQQAQQGAFGTRQLDARQTYNWVVSAPLGRPLYWGAYPTGPGPMPTMQWRGTAFGGTEIIVP